MTHRPTLFDQLTGECHNKLMAYKYDVIQERLINVLKDKHYIIELTIQDAQDLMDVMEDEPFPMLNLSKLYSYINK